MLDTLLSAGLDWLGWEGQKDFARENRAFQAKREDNAIQRRTKDLIAAGLNPMLAYNGAAASAASASQPSSPSFGESVSRGAQARTASAQQALMRAQERVQAATERNINADTGVKTATAAEIGARIESLYQGTAKAWWETQLLQLESNAKLEDWEYDRVLKRLAHDFQAASVEEKKLMLPRMRNLAKAEESWWKKEIAPYIDDAHKIGGAIGANLIGGALMRKPSNIFLPPRGVPPR